MPLLTDNPSDQERDTAIRAILTRVGGNAGAATAITQALPDVVKSQLYDYAKRKSVDDEADARAAVGKRLTITKLIFQRDQPVECVGTIDVDPNGNWRVHSVVNGKVRIAPQQNQVIFEVPHSQIPDLLK